jgi:hypothetical protein
VTEKWLALVVRRGEKPRKVAHRSGASSRLALSADGAYAALAGEEGRLEVWSLSDLVCVAWTELGSAATSVVFHGETIVVATSAGGFRAFELQAPSALS